MSVLRLCFHNSVHCNALSQILSSSKRRFCGRMEGALRVHFHRPTPIPHTLKFCKLHIDVYYMTSRRSTSPPAHLLSYRGMNTWTCGNDNHCARPTLEEIMHPFTEIDRTDVLEWNYHIIYWFIMPPGDASKGLDNQQNIAADVSSHLMGSLRSLDGYSCNTCTI